MGCRRLSTKDDTQMTADEQRDNDRSCPGSCENRRVRRCRVALLKRGQL